jgi:shikimate kinase
MMGSGKSHWCKLLSNELAYEAYDLDAIIETQAGKTIADIFASEGEAYFRSEEARLLREFAFKNRFLLATGGGTPCFYDNMEWMNANGTTIWIDETVEVLVQRLKLEKEHRPLIKPLTDEALNDFIIKKLEERKGVYAQSSIHLQGEDINLQRIVQLVNAR